LGVWLAIDLDAVEGPRCNDNTLAVCGDRTLPLQDIPLHCLR